MMETKFNFNGNPIVKQFFSIVFILGLLFTVNAYAQLQQVQIPQRDSSLNAGHQITRTQFNALTFQQQMDFLYNTPFTVLDLENATYNDFINAAPDEFFFTPRQFYEAPANKQQMYLTNPDKFKIYRVDHD
jgi:hypothetical protein